MLLLNLEKSVSSLLYHTSSESIQLLSDCSLRSRKTASKVDLYLQSEKG